jgi:hypothetical protein
VDIALFDPIFVHLFDLLALFVFAEMAWIGAILATTFVAAALAELTLTVKYAVL